MAYRRPAIEVIQEFQDAAVALALPSLPACVVGPGFQVKDDVVAGIYDEDELGTVTYAYIGLTAGAIVDTSAVPATDAEANAHKPVGVKLTDAYLVKKAQAITGRLASANLFQDPTTGAFASFDPDAAGAPTYYVEVISGGGLDAADIGRKLVIGKNSDNELIVAAEWQTGGLPFSNAVYRILEFREEEVYPPSSYADNGIVPGEDGVAISAGLQSVTDATPLDVVEGNVVLAWRALRPDLANALSVFTDLDSLEAVFGVGAVVPANIGAYGVNLALQNTTTEVNYTGLGEDFFTNEEQSFQDALEFLEAKDVYALAVLSHNTAVHQLAKAHVEGMSLSTVGRERVCMFNRKLVELEVVVPASGLGTETTAGTNNGTSGATNLTFKDPTNGTFITDDVNVGHFIEITDYTAVEGVHRSVTPNERDWFGINPDTIQLTAGEFVGGDVGRFVIVDGATTTLNDVEYEITAITSGARVVVTPEPDTAEVLPSTARAWIADLNREVTHNAADAVVAATKTWSFVNGAFTSADVGRLLFMRGTGNAGNAGAFTIGSVVSGTQITTIEAPGANETFGGGVTQAVYGINREPGRDVSADSVDATSRIWTILNASFTSADVGRVIRVTGATNGANNDDHVIESVISPTQAKTDNATTPVNEEFNGLDTPTLTVLDIVSVDTSDDEDAYILGTRHEIAAIVSETQLTLASDPTAGFGGTLEDVVYRITRDLSLTEQAELLAGYATSFASRRAVHTWPDVLAVSINSVATPVPGYFAGAVIAGITAGLPSQAGLTNLSVTGFVGRENSDDKFSDTQLDTIAGGGNMVFVQPVVGAALSIRHQLTTDLSTIYFQEYSVTKNVDLIARFFRGLYKPYLGIYNITDTVLDLLKTRGEGGLTFLKNQRAPRVGAPLRSGEMARIEESSSQPDTVEIDIDISVPLPLNNIKLTLLV
jgi:hypothetical protein